MDISNALRTLKVLIALLYLPMSMAAATVPFSGPYEFRGVTDLGPEVRLELRLEVINHTGADISGASLVVRDGLFSKDTFHSWNSLILFESESIMLSGVITVPRKVLENWRRSGGPRLLMRYRNAQGDSKTALVRLSSRRVVED